MAHRVLVIASQTASSPDLLEAVKARAERGSVAITLLMPATEPGLRGQEKATPQLDEALATWREAGLEAEGIVGNSDPIEALNEIWTPSRFDEVIVSTLPGSASKWLTFDFPHIVARITDVPVMHVVARPPGWQAHPGGPPPAREKNLLGPLSVLSWGGPRKS